MGVRHLWDILESCKKTLPLEHLQNKRICIDLSCWIVQLQKVNQSHCPMKDKVYLRGLFHRLRALIALNCTLILVADGSIPQIKLSTYRRRLNSDGKISQDETVSHRATSLQRNMGSEFSCMIKEAKVLGMALGIPFIVGVEEAEAQCALLNSESLCDGCFTSDSDAFLFGARTVYRDICLGEGGYVVCYEMNDIERKLGFGRNSLITLGILLGSDYSAGVHRLGQESACQIVKSVGESSVLQRVASEGLSFAKKCKGSKKHGQVLRCTDKENCAAHATKENGCKVGAQSDNQCVPVIEAYLRPKCHSADSVVVHRALGLHPFDRTKLHQVCARYFEWPPDKTDEYILPKIAERELRKFANLRSTSSDLGLQPPWDKMPVRCPIVDIIKQRKVQGKECFEVSWAEIDGLQTSIVTADLVERACPEKIMEFEERKAQGKKQNHRKPSVKKSDKTAPTTISEIDKKLQDLLLDIERENIAVRKEFLSRQSQTDKAGAVTRACQINEPLLLDTESSSSGERVAYRVSHVTSSSEHKAEVIDLLSPPPQIRPRNVSKCQQANVPCVEVIDLSESENEASPEHAKKVGELRQFLASIR